jgi:hypothetical protein
MQYKFSIEKVASSKYYFIRLEDEKFYPLGRLSDDSWTSQKAQELIDGVENSRENPKGQEYVWASEDLTLYSNINGVLLLDMISQRAGVDDPEKVSLQLSHNEFIIFMKDFKKFIEENS